MSHTPKPPKRRDGQIQCRNCPKFFTPREKGGSPQGFCSATCRKQFHRNGAAFGKLRDKLPEYIRDEVRRQIAEPILEELRADLARHDDLIADLRESVNAIIGGLDAPRV